MTYKEYLVLAIPLMLSTVTQPLLGAADTAVIGRLENPSYIGGVAIGAVIFNTMYWLFGFLRVSTSGFSAQSLGNGDEQGKYQTYLRPFMLAAIIGCLFIVLRHPIMTVTQYIYKTDQTIIKHVQTYFYILIWGAPLVLIKYVNLGWLMGRKMIKQIICLQISSNVLNIILDIIFVVFMHKGIAGVAHATLIAQGYSFDQPIFVLKQLQISKMHHYCNDLFNLSEMKKIGSVNLDLMIRTVCLLIMTNVFISQGALIGTTVLACNAVIYQIQYIISYLFDGLSNATSIVSGRSVGSGNKSEFLDVVRISSVSAFALSALITVAVVILKNPLLSVFTDIEAVLVMSKDYIPWMYIFPVTIGIGMAYYGLFVGAAFTSAIRNSMAMALILFLLTCKIAIPLYGNHGLWLAFILFSLTRSITMYMYEKGLAEKLFGECTETVLEVQLASEE